MKRVIALLFACAAALAYAHQDETQAPQQRGYDCEHPPADAISVLPGLMGEIGRLTCLPAGQAIVASGQWTWRYTGSFFDMPTVPAHAHNEAMGLMPPFYFKEISVRELGVEQAAARSKTLAEQIATYRPEGELAGMTLVDAVNNYGHTIEMILTKESDNKGWLLVCTPECRADYVIILERRQAN